MRIFTPKNGERGVAMLMAMVTMLVLTVLAADLVYQSQVYSGLVFRQRDQLQATLLARSALRLGLLQLRAAAKAKAKAKAMGLGENGELVNRIWKTPLVLPPPIPPDLDLNSRMPLEEFTKSLGLQGTLTTSISGENDRVSLNQLVWMSSKAGAGGGSPGSGGGGGGAVLDKDGKPIATGGDQVGSASTTTPEAEKEAIGKSRKDFAQLLQDLLEKKRLSDDAFRDKYPTVTGEQLMGNLLAWMDPKTQVDGDNQDKASYYTRAQPTPYSLKDAPIASLSELYMVKGFDDTLARLIGDNFTAQMSSSLDVNTASATLLQAYIPELTADALEKLLKRRTDETQGGPFKTDKDFWAYLNTLGRYDDAQKRLTDRGLSILGEESVYRVVITATSGMAHKTWVAAIGAFPPKVDSGAQQPGPQQPQPAPQPGNQATAGQGGAAPGTASQNNDSDSLHIVYLKAE